MSLAPFLFPSPCLSYRMMHGMRRDRVASLSLRVLISRELEGRVHGETKKGDGIRDSSA